MKHEANSQRVYSSTLIVALSLAALFIGGAAQAGDTGGSTALFDGESLSGWKAAENPATWGVRDGCLIAQGKRSHLFYTGTVGGHDFKNFELEVEAMTGPGADSGIYFHTEYQEAGRPKKGYEAQINNAPRHPGKQRGWQRTGSLDAVRNIAKAFVKDGEWFRIRIRVVNRRIRVQVNQYLTVDYLQPNSPARTRVSEGRGLAQGTIALQGHGPGSVVHFRRVAIRPLPDDANAGQPPRASKEGYGLTIGDMDKIAGSYLPFIDFHVHLRGGMTVEKAVARQAVTGINVGVLRNIGAGWPIETDEQLRAFLGSVTGRPVFVGLQVNDRGWHEKHSPALLEELDFVLGDTMIMPMPTDDSPPVKLWQGEHYTIANPEGWMERYVRHNLRVLAEPITILANPTYLPPAVEDRYDELWTEARMERVIRAAVANGVALEINARSGYPDERFIRMAKKMGAKFTFGSNNFLDKPIDMSRCVGAIEKYGLTDRDLYLPEPKP